jgi:hypothetical protein
MYLWNKRFLLDKFWSKKKKTIKHEMNSSILSSHSAVNLKHKPFNFSVPALQSKAQVDTKTQMETHN